jgi:hypothetical protein
MAANDTMFKCFRYFQTCCKPIFQVFQMYHTDIAKVNREVAMVIHIRMLQAYVPNVSSVLQASVLNVSSVFQTWAASVFI